MEIGELERRANRADDASFERVYTADERSKLREKVRELNAQIAELRKKLDEL
jgi:hypothetical protein